MLLSFYEGEGPGHDSIWHQVKRAYARRLCAYDTTSPRGILASAESYQICAALSREIWKNRKFLGLAHKFCFLRQLCRQEIFIIFRIKLDKIGALLYNYSGNRKQKKEACDGEMEH